MTVEFSHSPSALGQGLGAGFPGKIRIDGGRGAT